MRLLRQSLVIGCCLLTAPTAPLAQENPVAPLVQEKPVAPLALERPAAPLAQEKSEIPGVYLVEGTNPKGQPYDGTVEIVARGDTFIFHWALSTEEAYGIGIMSHGLLVVAAGSPTPTGVMLSNVVSYTLKPGESLVGEWATPATPGVYKEILTKLPASHPRLIPQPREEAKPNGKPDRTL